MTKSDEGKWSKVIITVILWAMPVVLAVGMQYQKLTNVCQEQKEIKTRVGLNEDAIIIIQSDMKHIKVGVDEIRKEVKKYGD